MGLDLGLGQCVAPFEGVVDQGFDGLHGLRSVAVVWPQRVHAAGAEAAMNSPTFGTDRRYIDRTSILPHPTAASEMSQLKVAEIGRATCWERGCEYGSIRVFAVTLTKQLN